MICKKGKSFFCFSLTLLFTILFSLSTSQMSHAVQVYITDVPGYGYNSAAYMSGGRFVGCGPTSGTMILDTYDNRLATPGALVGDPLTTAWDLHNNYMNTDAFGFGPPSDFHYGMEDYAFDQGFLLDAVIHVEPTNYNPADWPYSVPDDLVADATFWNTSTWDIIDNDFLNFIKPEIDAGDPVMLTVDSDGINKDDHWMVGVGYDLDTGQWAGYNTWDSALHWYDVESAFIAGNTMGIAYVRTFDFLGAIDNGSHGVPEPTTMLLLGVGLLGLVGVRRRFVK